MRRKWTGTLTCDLTNFGDGQNGRVSFKKGQRVIVWKRRTVDEDREYKGDWEYHYTDPEGTNLVRCTKFLIDPE